MSPLPSPTPVRSALLRMIFSPTGLLLGFVVLIIATCPNARGEDAISLLGSSNGLQSSVVDLARFDIPVAPSQPAPVIGRSTRLDRAPVSSARSATPMERGIRAPGSVDTEAFGAAGSPLPLLGDPMEVDAARATSANLNPMTGPTVGIRPKLPRSGR